jgi:hypothetical protein
MKAASIIGFIAGLCLIAWVILANAEASPQWSGFGDRAPFTAVVYPRIVSTDLDV